MQLNLTDYEAQLLEQRLRGRTVSFSDADHLAIQGIADRLLAGEVEAAQWTHLAPDPKLADVDVVNWIFSIGDPDPIKAPPLRRFYVMEKDDYVAEHLVRRETDEYACSCGARWDVSDGADHPR